MTEDICESLPTGGTGKPASSLMTAKFPPSHCEGGGEGRKLGGVQLWLSEPPKAQIISKNNFLK